MTEYRTLTSREELAGLGESWEALVCAAPRPCPFFTHEWLDPWWKHHGADREMLVEAAVEDGRLVGAVPIEVERRARLVRVVHFMGRHHAALADVLVGPGAGPEVGATLLQRAARHGDYADLFGLPPGGAAATTLAGRETLTERIEAPVLDLSRGWDEVYRERTSSKRRNLHRRRRRQLDEEGGLTVTVAHEPDELAAALEDAFALHDLRWAGRPDGSEFTTLVGRAFHRDAVRSLGARGMARILTLHVAGRPVAFHYYILFAGRMYVHRLAFDPALARFSPGLIATLDAIERASEEGATTVEFLGGGERYKVELADRTAPLLQCVGLATSRRGAAVAAAERAVIAARLRLKQHEGLHRAYTGGVTRPLARIRGVRPDVG